MVRVIGKDPNAFKQATCSRCGSINEYTKNDIITLWSGTDYSGGADGARGFKCACCQKDVILERW